MARFAVPRSLLAQARLPSTALQSVAPRRHAHQVALIPTTVPAPNPVPSIPAPHSHAPSTSTSSASGPTPPTAQDIPSSLSSADVFGRRISPSDELSMSRDCKSRVGDALRAGRDPLDAGQIYPTQDAALGSYYLFYSGVKQALPTLEPPPVLEPRTEVVDIPGQGKGVLARRAFQTGELVVAERPLLVMPAVDMSLSASVAKGSAASRTVTMRNWCLSGLIRDSMRPSDLDALAALHNAHSSSTQDYASIFNTNALSIPSLPGHDAPYGALCAHLARINHSCSPNAYWRWDLSSFSVHLYAARPIAEGEQLSIPYVSLLQPHAARQDTLLDRYIFRCTCSACRGTRADRMAHDARRASLKAFTESPIAAGALSARASKAVVGAVQAARQEGYFFADVWSPALCYGARAAIALGDGEGAARYARRAAKLASVVTGADGGWARLAMAPHRAKGWKAAVGAADEAGLSEVVDVLGTVPY